jgi:hypothetical protein
MTLIDDKPADGGVKMAIGKSGNGRECEGSGKVEDL